MNKLLADRSAKLLAAAIAGCMLVLVFQRTFVFLYQNWQREEYSHGWFIPLISGFLIWQRRWLLPNAPVQGSWIGALCVAFGLTIYFVGTASSIVGVDAFALDLVIAGCVLAVWGGKGFKVIAVPIALLLLMNPLPTFWYNHLSSELQLLSSQIGVGIIRALGVSVFLEGNVIDLGSYKLEVAEACSGLRYLFPLMTLGAIFAYQFKSRTWMRWCLFLSTIPITVLMNGLRVGIIGVLVDHFGAAQAEGFLHDFEGWMVFMLSFILLPLECKLLMRIAGDRRPLAQALSLTTSAPAARPAATRLFRLGGPAIAVLALLLLSAYPALALPQRTEIRPDRRDFSRFPLSIQGWTGYRQQLEGVYLDALQLDDYLLMNFAPAAQTSGSGLEAPINLYVAYYASQRTGHSVHSPSSCLPGGGWRLQQAGPVEVSGVTVNGAPLRVNRAIIQQDAERQLVYYWFMERGRALTSEYIVKWYLAADAVTRHRSDGALVRLIMPLPDGADPARADAQMGRFAAAVVPELRTYLPN
jgi:exosortase D (VPLPA-CTERM-specific)